MEDLFLEEIKYSDASEVLALIIDSFSVNDPFAVSGVWTK
jgi:hypothetical protein